MRYSGIILILQLAGMLSACTEQDASAEKEPVWKTQTDMIDKANDVQKVIDTQAIKQRQQIEDQLQ